MQRFSISSCQIQFSWVHRHSDFFGCPLSAHFFSHETGWDQHCQLHRDLPLFRSRYPPIWLNYLHCLGAFCSGIKIDSEASWLCLGHSPLHSTRQIIGSLLNSENRCCFGDSNLVFVSRQRCSFHRHFLYHRYGERFAASVQLSEHPGPQLLLCAYSHHQAGMVDYYWAHCTQNTRLHLHESEQEISRYPLPLASHLALCQASTWPSWRSAVLPSGRDLLGAWVHRRHFDLMKRPISGYLTYTNACIFNDKSML